MRAALTHLALGFSLGALLLAQKGLVFASGIERLLVAHVDALLLGWMAQLAMGVAYWILPRIEGRRGREPLLWSALALLNVGVGLVGLQAWIELPGALQLAGRLAEGLAVLAFAVAVLPRVKPPPLV